MPMASGTFLQMDQAAPPHQIFLRHQRERRKNSSMDRRLRVRSHRYHQKTLQPGSKPVYDPTNIERDYLRKNISFTDAYKSRHALENACSSQPIESI